MAEDVHSCGKCVRECDITVRYYSAQTLAEALQHDQVAYPQIAHGGLLCATHIFDVLSAFVRFNTNFS